MEPMQHAIQSALDGMATGHGGPFGACVVKGDKMISVAHNTVLRDQDPTCHAEVNAIRMASRYLGTYDLSECEIYSTAEPCPMCLGAIYWARLSKIHVGVSKECSHKHGWSDLAFYEEMHRPLAEKNTPIVMGILPEDCEALFAVWAKDHKEFY